MKYSLIRTFSTADGKGIRTAVYFSGCQKAMEGNPCIGCHNSKAWDKDVGNEWGEQSKVAVLESLRPEYINGLSILGGEPTSTFNIKGVIDLAKTAKEWYPEKDIWLWTGYDLEERSQEPELVEDMKELKNYVDMFIDGPFVNELKDPGLKFRGSKNQRILMIDHGNGNEVIDVTEEIDPASL